MSNGKRWGRAPDVVEQSWVGARLEGWIPTIVFTYVVASGRGRGLHTRRRETLEMPRNWMIISLGVDTRPTPEDYMLEKDRVQCG